MCEGEERTKGNVRVHENGSPATATSSVWRFEVTVLNSHPELLVGWEGRDVGTSNEDMLRLAFFLHSPPSSSRWEGRTLNPILSIPCPPHTSTFQIKTGCSPVAKTAP